MTDRVLSYILENKMLDYGDGIVCGLSGGADSTALMLLLCSLRDRLGIKLCCVHINHMYRGAEADRDESFSYELCKKYSVPFYCEHIDVVSLAKKAGRGVEEYARECRYAAFEKYLPKNGKIATAHNCDDNLETMLFNIARGTGLAGLCGIPPVRGNIIRPLLCVTREEIEKYLFDCGQDYVTDSTNLCDDYSRNVIRHHVVTALRMVNEKAAFHALSLSEDIRTARAELCGTGGEIAEKLKIIEAAGGNIDRATVNRAYEIRKNGVGKLNITGNRFLIIDERGYRTVPDVKRITVAEEKTFSFCDIQLAGKMLHTELVSFEEYQDRFAKDRTVRKNAVSCELVGNEPVLRTRRGGDKIRLSHRGVTKTLKKLYSEMKTDPASRNSMLVLADSDGVFWAEGAGSDARVLPRDGDSVCILCVQTISHNTVKP